MRERIKKLSLQNVSYRFQDGTEILKDVNFDLPLGKCVAVKGEPGSGKSLFLKVLAGVLDPKGGRVLYNEKNISKMTFEEFTPLRLSTAICFENGGLLMNKTIEENLKISLLYHKQWRAERSENLFLQLVKDFKLGKTLHLRPAQISEGARRLVGIARCFLINPQIIFLDEPSLSIGTEGIDMLKTWIENHRKEKKDATIFFTTQDKELLKSVDCEKLVLENSKLKKAA